ncbi:hypothetical protein [Variovorax sp. RA8]|uniref:hypothetical protein n=1 Tax=Variovorax sp. (strain JCM 16519 / RA8) TaxID=662548 RepID=UPI001E4CA296|nr:hypothetical protein [Variovorax sp. RA8]
MSSLIAGVEGAGLSCAGFPMSMFIAGLAGAGFSCADAIGADKAQAMIAEINIEVFMAIFQG